MNAVPELIDGGKFVDDRGPLSFVNGFAFEGVRRLYQVENHRAGFIRAWHGHKIEGKYVYVPKGVAIVCAALMSRVKLVKDKPAQGYTFDIHRVVLSSDTPKVYWIPPGYYNGFMNLTENTIVQFFSTTTMEESKGDDYRLDWDSIRTDVWEVDYR